MIPADAILRALLDTLRGPEPTDATARELAEAAWLAARWAVPQMEPIVPPVVAGSDEDPPEDDPETPPAPSRERPQTPAPLDSPTPTLGAAHPDGEPGYSSARLGLPPAPGLDDRIGHVRGLSGLATRRADASRRGVDLPTSLRRSAMAGEPLLVTLSGERAATQLLVLFDTSPSLSPWSGATAALIDLAARTTGLADVQILAADLSDPSAAPDLAARLRPGLDPLVVLWSDGLAPGFLGLGPRIGALPPSVRVAWMHPWPAHAWRRTPAGRLAPARLGRPTKRVVPLVVVPFAREGWAALGAWMLGRRPGRFPVVGLPRQIRSAPADSPKDWATHRARLTGVLEPESLRLLGLAAGLATERYDLDMLRALALAAGQEEDRFHLAEALTTGFFVRHDEGGFRFRDGDARATARASLVDADLSAVAAVAKRAGLAVAATVGVDVPTRTGGEGEWRAVPVEPDVAGLRALVPLLCAAAVAEEEWRAASHTADVLKPLAAFRVGSTRIEVLQGSIAEARGFDALVSSDDTDLSHGGGVSAAIWRAAQRPLLPAPEGPLTLGDVHVTDAGALPARRVLHAVTVDVDAPRRLAGDTARRLWARVIETARTHGLSTVVAPLLGTGAAQAGIDTSVGALLVALEGAGEAAPRRLALVGVEGDAARAVEELMRRGLPRHSETLGQRMVSCRDALAERTKLLLQHPPTAERLAAALARANAADLADLGFIRTPALLQARQKVDAFVIERRQVVFLGVPSAIPEVALLRWLLPGAFVIPHIRDAIGVLPPRPHGTAVPSFHERTSRFRAELRNSIAQAFPDDGPLLLSVPPGWHAAARRQANEQPWELLITAGRLVEMPDGAVAGDDADLLAWVCSLDLWREGLLPFDGLADALAAELGEEQTSRSATPDRPPEPPPRVPLPTDSRDRRMTRQTQSTIQGALKALEADLLARTRAARVEAGLRASWEAEQKAGQTGLGFDPWRRERVTQIAVAWVLSIVFVRTLEDRGYIDPRLAGGDASGLAVARDRSELFRQLAPMLGDREYLLTVFRELAKLPGARHVFDTRHNPVWVLSPSAEGAEALLDFFRRTDEAGRPLLTFPGSNTRFLGDLYQDLSEDARKRYALLQTPEFVEEFILDQTLDPAIEAYGLDKVTLIDPTCGSGHFLLGAFHRLLARHRAARPMEAVQDLARRALDQVYGVDINPYAVAIARFRLVLAVLDEVGIRRLDRAPDLTPNLVVADSLLHTFQGQTRLAGQLSLLEQASWGDALFALEDRAEVERVLTRRFHAVVGNPPYITEKDPKKREKYREMYASAAGKYALAAPFTERFFGLAVEAGFVGLINSNAWTKRDYGKTLIEEVLPKLDVQKIIDTSGCYIPGHGTPTLLLFGRNREPGDEPVTAVLGKRGEQEEPKDAAKAPVWREIIEHHGEVGFDGDFVSVDALGRSGLAVHPWVLMGGGARVLSDQFTQSAGGTLCDVAESIGITCFTLGDDAFINPPDVFPRVGIPAEHHRSMVEGDRVRDWTVAETERVCFPYNASFEPIPDHGQPVLRFLWPSRTTLGSAILFGGKTKVGAGVRWYEYGRLSADKLRTPVSIVFAFVGTHNHFTIDRGGRVFKQTAPIIKLHPSHTEADHQALLGYLNSSTVGFWCRLVMFPKGGDQVGEGARLSKTPWQDRLEYAGNLLQQLPVPDLARLRSELIELVVAAEDIVRRLSDAAPTRTLALALEGAPTRASLRRAAEAMLAERARLRGILVSLQEEMDWRVYGLFGLPTLPAPSVDAVLVPVAPEHRPFEVRLARDVGTDISASEWFRIHHRTPPADVAGPLADLYRQRLRLLEDDVHGKELRLLETPETKRRWSPPDDAGAFVEAARAWLLDRIEQVFRDQPTPELLLARQVALALARDPRVHAVHELLTEESGLDLARLVADLTDAEGVPFLAALRYTATGLEKRRGSNPDQLEGWELTWELQRAEDAGRLDAALKEHKLKAIPVPDKYGPPDFQRHYWGLRGALDVPKERFVTVAPGASDDDPTPLVGWAGWDHLQQAQALSGLYQRRKVEDGWTKDRLLPLLAGLDEQVPWLLQWHDDLSPTFGVKLGSFFSDFVAAQAHELGVSVADLRAWRPEKTTRGRAPSVTEAVVLAALRAWDGAADATPDELAERLGAPKAAVTKHLKALVASGAAEQTSGRPARYKAGGG